MPKPITTEEFKARSKKTHGDFYDYSKSIYTNATSKLIIRCPIHGVFEQSGYNHACGSRCPGCALESNRAKNSVIRGPYKTTENFVERAKTRWGKKFMYKDSVYTGTKEPIIVGCRTHGNFWTNPNSHLNGAGCPKCRGYGFNKKEVAKEIAQALPEYELLSVSLGIKGGGWAKLKCSIHGVFTRSRLCAVKFKQGCEKCARIKNGLEFRYDTETFIEKAQQKHKDKYSYEKTDYTAAHGKVTITCPKHGDFEQRGYSHLNGRGCPSCNTSQIEVKVAKWVQQRAEVQRNVKCLGRQEIDILVPNHGLGIEVNGVYWHSEQFLEHDYHYKKALRAKRSNIKLLQFWDHELKDKTKICKSMISGSLGLNEKYHARKLEIKEIPNQKTWFDTNHLQGGTGSRVAYGLFNGDECLAAMSFGAPRFNRNYQWEIVRFANALNTTVVGGATRLWAHFVKTHQPRSVVSYADLRISQGKLYRTLGFRLSHRSAPNYFWCKAGGHVLPRYQTQKSKLAKLLKDFDGEKTEKANMQNAGWNRIWDAGNLVFVYNTDPDGKSLQE